MLSISRWVCNYGRRIGTHYCGRRTISSAKFEVERLSTKEEVRELVFARAARNGWRPGALDHISFFSVDNSGFFVGKLNGEPICSLFFLKYNDEYMYAGGFLVDEKYRRSGYGYKTWDTVTSWMNITNYNVCGDSILELIPLYSNNYGFKPSWCMQCFDINASEAVSNYSTIEKDRIEIVSSAKDVYPALQDYDTHVHVYPRPSFLKNWVTAPNCHCAVAIDGNGAVVGYGVVRTVFGDKNGWRIGPLFADSSSIAGRIYQDLCLKVAANDSEAVITLDATYGKGFNPDSLGLLTDTLKATPIFQMMRIYTNGIPKNMPLHKVFVMT